MIKSGAIIDVCVFGYFSLIKRRLGNEIEWWGDWNEDEKEKGEVTRG